MYKVLQIEKLRAGVHSKDTLKEKLWKKKYFLGKIIVFDSFDVEFN